MTSRKRTIAIVLALELLVGAVIWFSSTPSDAEAETAQAPSMNAANPEPTKKCPKPEKVWRPNEKVTHPEHGVGVVVSSEGAGVMAEVVVDFGDGPETFRGWRLGDWRKPLSGDLLPIGILILVIVIVVVRLPRVELGHTTAF